RSCQLPDFPEDARAANVAQERRFEIHGNGCFPAPATIAGQATDGRRWSRLMANPLTIFVPHCSDLLTDHLPNGDGLIAHGFISNLARRGHRLHVAAQRVELQSPLHSNITLYEIPVSASSPLVGRLEYMFRVRRLLSRLRKDYRFDLIHQLNPVFTGTSLAMIGSG